MRLFLEKIRTWIGRLSKAVALPNVGGIGQSTEDWKEQNIEEEENFLSVPN